MKTILQFFCTLCIFVFCFNHVPAAAAADESGFQLTIELRDGSRVVGKSLEDTLSFHSSALGDAKLPWAGIRSIDYAGSTNTARLAVTNGDMFTVQLTADTVSLETGFGKSDLPVKLIRNIKVSPIARPYVPPASVAAAQTGSQLTIELRDGSHIVGKGLDDSLSFHSSALGDLKLTWDGIRSIEYATTNTDTAQLTATNGDAYAVQFATSTVRVETSFGKTELPVNLIRSIKVSQASPVAKFGQLPSGLVALWSGEGNAIDSMGDNNGNVVGNVTYGNGKIGQGFVFDGRTGRVDIGNPIQLQLQDFTITAWIKRDSASSVSYHSHNGILNSADIFSYAMYGYELNLDPEGRPALVKVGFSATSSDVAIKDTDWHHLAVTKSGSAVIFYIDGNPYPAPAFGLKFVFSRNASIGGKSSTYGYDDNFAGLIDEVAIYNRPLSTSEIQTIYMEQSGTPLPLPLKATRKSTTTTITGTFRYEIKSSTH